jgi:DNA-binding MarR family transcriptional regulator
MVSDTPVRARSAAFGSIIQHFELKVITMDTESQGAERPNLPDVLQFMQLLWAVVHGLQRTSKRMTGEIGVTGPQRLVLRVVGLCPGLSAGDLATVLRVHPSTLTGVLQRLVGHRLLTRAHDPHDRRRAVLRLTKRGVRVNAVRQGTVEAAVAQALEGIGERDRAAARRVLARLARDLQPSAPRPSARRSQDHGRSGKGVER